MTFLYSIQGGRSEERVPELSRERGELIYLVDATLDFAERFLKEEPKRGVSYLRHAQRINKRLDPEERRHKRIENIIQAYILHSFLYDPFTGGAA